MRKIIPFLFVVIMVGVFVLVRMRVIQTGQVVGVASLNLDAVEDGSLVSSVEHEDGSVHTNGALSELSLVNVSLVTTTGTNTQAMVRVNDSAASVFVWSEPQLVPVQPGFGGGGGSQQLQHLPEYKAESVKVDPVIEFEYCN